MTPRHTTSPWAPMAAILLFIALVATACGAGATESTEAQRISLRAPAPAPLVASAGVSESGHEYGSTLQEWGAASAPSESGSEAQQDGSGGASAESDFASIEWTDLIPPGFTGPEIMDRYEDRLDEIEPGTAEADELFAEIQAAFDPEAINPELDGQEVRLAGFVAPLTYDDEIVTEFLLVPNFGACIHVPPPPPNQTIMVTVDRANGLTPEEAWGPVWVEGTIVVDSSTTDLAAASYRIESGASGVYEF